MTITSQPSFLSKRKKKGGGKGKLLYTVFSNYSCLNLSEISEISWQKVNSFSIKREIYSMEYSLKATDSLAFLNINFETCYYSLKLIITDYFVISKSYGYEQIILRIYIPTTLVLLYEFYEGRMKLKFHFNVQIYRCYIIDKNYCKTNPPFFLLSFLTYIVQFNFKRLFD